MLTSHSLEIPLVSLYPPAPICPHTDHIPAAVLARRHRHLRIGPGLNIRTSRPCPALTADTKTIGPPNGGKFEGGGTCSSQLLASLVCTIGSAFSGISPQAQVRWLVVIQQNVTMCFSLFLTKEIWKHVKSGKVRRRTYLLVIASR